MKRVVTALSGASFVTLWVLESWLYFQPVSASRTQGGILTAFGIYIAGWVVVMGGADKRSRI